MATLTAAARQTLLEKRTGTHGEAGAAWVERLPDLITSISREWSLKVGPHFENLSYNYVTPVRCSDGTDAVLKLSYPDDPESIGEIEALRLLSGPGYVRLLDCDMQLGAALIQRADPGLPVSTLQSDSAQVHAAATVMLATRRPQPKESAFPTIGEWLDKVASGAKGLDLPNEIASGIALGRELVAKPGSLEVVLHGDLHHNNILSSGDGWLAIDPKGVLGEPAWEVGPYLYNNLPDADGEAAWRTTIRNRADQFADEFDLDRHRIYACSLAYAALSCAWSLQEGGEIERMAKRFAAIRELASH